MPDHAIQDIFGKQAYLVITPEDAHPSSEGNKPVWAVRRWKSGFAGNIRILGTVNGSDQGDGTNARVFVDGEPVWKQFMGGNGPLKAKFDLTVPVKTGSLVDFAVDPGPGTDNSYDATEMVMTITHLPDQMR